MPAGRYKLQTRHQPGTSFTDVSDWLDCDACRARMQELRLGEGELRIINDLGHIIATTQSPLILP